MISCFDATKDTSLAADSTLALREHLPYYSDYHKVLDNHYTFVHPIDEGQGVRARILNFRAEFIGRLLYYFFGTAVALFLLTYGIGKQVRIIRRQDELAHIREDFSYAMIHDMKTPITSILMGLKVLRSGKVADKPVSFRLHIEEEDVYADEEYLKEAVSNLIDNAIKYSKESVEIEITSCLNHPYTQIKVRDNGIGIPLAAQRTVFDKFERVVACPDGTTPKVSGFGLGLNYVMNVARAHGGYVSVESREGKYSEFTISLPS